MDFDTYQRQALESIAISDQSLAALSHRTLGITGEAGILANQIKKVIRDKNGQADSEDLEIVKKRLGDILYYVAALADNFNFSLSDIASQNLEQSKSFKVQ